MMKLIQEFKMEAIYYSEQSEHIMLVYIYENRIIYTFGSMTFFIGNSKLQKYIIDSEYELIGYV